MQRFGDVHLWFVYQTRPVDFSVCTSCCFCCFTVDWLGCVFVYLEEARLPTNTTVRKEYTEWDSRQPYHPLLSWRIKKKIQFTPWKGLATSYNSIEHVCTADRSAVFKPSCARELVLIELPCLFCFFLIIKNKRQHSSACTDTHASRCSRALYLVL